MSDDLSVLYQMRLLNERWRLSLDPRIVGMSEFKLAFVDLVVHFD